MTERDPSTRQISAAEQQADGRESTTPGITPAGSGASPAGSGGHGYPGSGESYYTAPNYSTRPVTVRRADGLAGLLLVLAGIAAAVSLALRWLREPGDIGWDLVNRGVDEVGGGIGDLLDSGFWQPLTVVLGGGVLLLLGLLVLLPARTHRFLGVLALFVSLLVAAAVLVPLASEDWDPGAFRIGFWFACAVAVLGLLGALKAMLTGPRTR